MYSLQKIDDRLEGTQLFADALLVENVEYKLERLNGLLDNQLRLLRKCQQEKLWKNFYFDGVKYTLKNSIKNERDLVNWCIKSQNFFKDKREAIKNKNFQAAVIYIRNARNYRQYLLDICKFLRCEYYQAQDLKRTYMNEIDKILQANLTSTQMDELELRYYFYNRLIVRRATEIAYNKNK